MKKLVSKIVYLGVLVVLFSLGNKVSAANCEIDYIEFSPFNKSTEGSQTQTFDRILIDDLKTTISVYPKDASLCAGKSFSFNVKSRFYDKVAYTSTQKFDASGNFSIPIFPGDNECEAPSDLGIGFCSYYVKINHNWEGEIRSFYSTATDFSGGKNPDTVVKQNKGEIRYKKSAGDSKEWALTRDNDTNDSCKILSMTFSPDNAQSDDFIDQGSTTTLKIKSQDCKGRSFHTKIYDKGNAPDRDAEIDVRGFLDDNLTTITYIPGDKGCDEDEDPFDCLFYAKLIEPKTETNLVWTSIATPLTIQKVGFSSEDKDDGEIYYNCHTIDGKKSCTKPWAVQAVSGVVNENGEPITVSSTPVYDPESPCLKNPDVPSDGYIEGCYDLLAPIPGIEGEYIDGEGNTRSTGFITDPETGRQAILTKDVEIGDYINQIFRIALGILMVVAVIMIIIAGVEYMTVESIFGKGQAKERIVNALTGLLIGLGIFLILSTINPKLLEVNFAPPEVSISFNADAGDGFNYDSPTPSGYPSLAAIPVDGSYKVKGCPQGIVKVNEIYICQSMSQKLTDLITAAKAAGYVLTGKGLRSREQQEWLRQRNCADPINTPPGQCNPATAKISNHEAGLAVDFKCNGQPLKGSQCFQWMKANAGSHGWKNLASEPWHWSYNGK